MKPKVMFLALSIIAAVVISTATVYAYYGGQRIASWQLFDESVTSSKILNYTIVNADISPTAGINSSQILDMTIANVDVAKSAVNDTQLASGAINGAVNKQTTEISVIGSTYTDAINKTITLNRTSLLLIIYSAQSKNEADNITLLKCTVGGVAADPTIDIQFMPAGRTGYEAASYIFYNSSVIAGTYNVNISMRSNSTGTCYVMNQSLAIQALPA